MSESAIDQRLRRACSNGVKKGASGGSSAAEMYKDLSQRTTLGKLLVDAKFVKAYTY